MAEQNIIKPNENWGEVKFQWNFKEYIQYTREKAWYIIVVLVLLLLLTYAVWTANFLFIVIILLFALIYFLQEIQKPLVLDFKITDQGIVLGSRFIPYQAIKKFWIIYQPPEVQKLYFDLKSIWQADFSIPLEGQDVLKIRNYLKQYLLEDIEKEEESTGDQISRILKL